MLLLAIPMYATPFVLVSLIGFAFCLATSRLRRYAIAVFVAPVAFGGFAAAGFIGWVLMSSLLKIDLRPTANPRGVFDGFVFFIAPGLVGSSGAVWAVNKAIRLWWRLPIAPSWIERTSVADADS